MKSTVFEYVIFFDPQDAFDTPVILAEGKLIASDLERAKLLAGREIPETHIDEIANIEVLVRPFFK